MAKTTAGGWTVKVAAAVVAFSTLLGAAPARCDERPSLLGPLALYSAGAFIDGASTEIALNRNRNASEGNPLMQGGTGTRVAMKIAEAALLTFLDREIAKKHPKGVKFFRALTIAARVAIAVHNLRQARTH